LNYLVEEVVEMCCFATGRF